MPFRSIATLESWLAEFEEIDYRVSGSARVIPQDGDGGADTGLVVYQLRNAPTLAYLEPDVATLEWRVTMQARDADSTMSPAAVQELAYELSIVSALCVFLRTKSREFMRQTR
jgi:hypothetical protein